MGTFKKIVIISLLLSSINSYAQEEVELWYKISPEITLKIKNTPWEFRWRPDDHIILPDRFREYIGKNNIARTDIMWGVNLWKLKIFNYSKFDELNRSWTGVRLDLNVAMAKNRLLFNIQERYFWGLNEKSADHYYLVQFIRYVITKKFRAGVLSYGKWDTDAPFSEGNWFIGPSVNLILPHNFNLHLAFTNDVLHTTIYMPFFRLGYKILWDIKGEINYDDR